MAQSRPAAGQAQPRGRHTSCAAIGDRSSPLIRPRVPHHVRRGRTAATGTTLLLQAFYEIRFERKLYRLIARASVRFKWAIRDQFMCT